MGHAIRLVSCIVLWGMTASAAAGSPGAPAVEIARFGCEYDDDDGWWIAITAQRKLIEWFADGGVDVASAFTRSHIGAAPERRIDGQVVLRDSVAALQIRLAHKGQPLASARLTSRKGDFRKLRSVLGEVLVYGLDVDRRDLSPKATSKKPTECNYAFGLYLLAKRALRAATPERAVELLEEAVTRDSLFAMACWTISEIHRGRDQQKQSKAWASRAAAIDPAHPRWPYLDPVIKQHPLEQLLKRSRETPVTRVAQGLSYKRIAAERYGLEAIVWNVDPRTHELDICTQEAETGDRIEQFHQRCRADVSLNGGFFEMDRNLHLSPSGLVVSKGQVLAPVSPKGGSGAFYIKQGRPGIAWSKEVTQPETLDLALQCGPVIVEPGAVMGVYSNDYTRVNRTAVGVTAGGEEVILAIVVGKHGQAVSLYELAQFLRTPRGEGGCGCDVALNLDGGSSSQMFADVKGLRLHVKGLWAVSNALVVRKK